MKKKVPRPLLGELLQKLAPQIGAQVLMESEWNAVGQIQFKNGKKSYFRYSSIDLNPFGAALLAKDKSYANYFMQSMGYPVVAGKAFYSPTWAKAIGSDQDIHAAYTHAKNLGWPVIVKPNSGMQGKGVALVYIKQEFYKYMREIFMKDQVALVEEYVQGKDYRIVVLDKEVVAAYERIPLSVIGDGKSTIETLLKKKQRAFNVSKRDTQIRFNDSRIILKLKREGLSLESIPAKGRRVSLLDNANLSSGGESVEVTEQIHPEFRKLAVALTKDMGLRFCGVDLLINGTIEEKPDSYVVLEVNASPGLDHYSRSGESQKKRVEELYLKILRLMENS